MRIALSALKQPQSVPHGVEKIVGVLKECRRQKVEIACFPETYLPGLRGSDNTFPPPDQSVMEEAMKELRTRCRENKTAAIVGMEWMSDIGLENRAFVISAAGRLLGYQTKNQITPKGESDHYVPDGMRRVFRLNGAVFGIVICHEGWRYPETSRWAVLRGAKIIFQPQVTGNDRKDTSYPSGSSALTHEDKPRSSKRSALRRWGDSFYEKAMVCRSQENSVYFASVNLTMKNQNSATSLIDPSGKLVDFIPYGKEGVLVADIDLSKSTRYYARKFKPHLYPGWSIE